MGDSTTWEIHPKDSLSTTLFSTLPRELKMVVERDLEDQMSSKGKYLYFLCPSKQNPNMGASSEKTDSRSGMVEPMQRR